MALRKIVDLLSAREFAGPLEYIGAGAHVFNIGSIIYITTCPLAVNQNLLALGVRSQAFTSAPENTVYVVGDTDPVFNCAINFGASDDYLTWNEYILDDINGRALSDADGIVPGLESDYALHGTNLRILHASLTDAGTYECRNAQQPSVQRRAELVVLGKTNIVSNN